MTYGVITKVCEPSTGGNLAMAYPGVYLDPQAKGGTFEDSHLPLGQALGQPVLDIYVRVPVFAVGELLVLDGNNRDQMGRKPSKWDVVCEEFNDIAAAVARAREVANGG